MRRGEATTKPTIRTIPSSDTAFHALVTKLAEEHEYRSPQELGRRLRRLLPRVLVRDRALSGEPPVWYVYRDGAWRPSDDGPWWNREGLPRIVISSDGYVVEANRLARGLLGLRDLGNDSTPHFSAFVAPGTIGDANALFEIVRSAGELVATVLVRPSDGDVIACDVRAVRDGDRLVGVFRLAADTGAAAATPSRPPAVTTHPSVDTVFRQFAEDVLANMAEPTPERLALVVHGLYPHAHVERGDDGTWELFRDGRTDGGPAEREWWKDASLPRLRYDRQGLILEANEAATAFLGRRLEGHFWHEFVTPTATDVVSPVIEIIRKAGVAVSRFRMPTGDGALVEFDSYTTAEGETLTTIMRPT